MGIRGRNASSLRGQPGGPSLTGKRWDIVPSGTAKTESAPQRWRNSTSIPALSSAPMRFHNGSHRAHTMKPTQTNFTCRTYSRRAPRSVQPTYIRECVLDEIVLADIRRVTAMARGAHAGVRRLHL